MVINIRALIDKDYATVEREGVRVVGCQEQGALVKVILETGYLDDAQKVIAAQINSRRRRFRRRRPGSDPGARRSRGRAPPSTDKS
jgi:hypothetical protein